MILTPHLKHLILAVIAGVLILLISWKVIAHLDGTAHDQAVLAKAQVDADLQKAKLQSQQTQVDKTALQNQLNILAQSNANLASKVSSLQNQLSDQRKQDASLNPNDLAGRWAGLVGFAPSEIQPTLTGLSVSLNASHSTVDALEEIPVIKQEEQALKDNSVQKDNTIGSLQKTLGSTEAELNTCKQTVKDQDVACKAEIKAVKAAERKHNVWATIGGIIVGIFVEKKIKL